MLAILSKLAAALSDFDFTLGSRSGAGAVTTGVTAAEYGDGVIHQTVLTLSSVAITMTDAGAAGSHGSKKVYDFPAGLIHILGATTNLTTLAGSGGIGDTGALVGSLGSVAVATDNATLTSTEANVVPSTDGTLVGGAGTLKGKSTADAVLDGTGTAIDLLLNLAVPDADSSADDTVTVSGTITITWVSHGDN